jgi:hypothetical protein
MKGIIKCIVLALSLMFCFPAVSAFAMSSVTIDPPGPLTAGTPVIITFKIDLTASGDETFPSGDELQMSTDLDSAQWTWSLVLDGVDTAQPSTSGRVLSVSGWILSYPSSMEESMKVTVQGKAPASAQTTNKTMLKVCEYDSHGNLLASSCVEKTQIIVNPAEITKKISEMEASLQTYRSHIDEKSALGIDTASGEAKYSEADQKIKAAKGLPSTQYLQAFSNLDAAKRAIEDGEIALDRAWAENELANAQIPINKVDEIIAWFRSNASTKDDAQLATIMTKREVAVSYLVTAQDEINNGNYDQARVKAQDAFNKGNESYTDALNRQTELGKGFFANLPIPKFGKLPIIPIIAVVVVVLVIVGVIIYRKRSHWDELG